MVPIGRLAAISIGALRDTRCTMGATTWVLFAMLRRGAGNNALKCSTAICLRAQAAREPPCWRLQGLCIYHVKSSPKFWFPSGAEDQGQVEGKDATSPVFLLECSLCIPCGFRVTLWLAFSHTQTAAVPSGWIFSLSPNSEHHVLGYMQLTDLLILWWSPLSTLTCDAALFIPAALKDICIFISAECRILSPLC